jgi:glycosyltransferase involved in cell wall biosynthesis
MKSFNKSVGLIAPLPPPFGGMAIQATKLAENLRMEGFNVIAIPTNMPLPKSLRILESLIFVRTISRSLFLLREVNRCCSSIDVFYFLTGFFDFFLWVTMPVLLLLRWKGKPVILSARGGDAGRFFRKWKPIARRILQIPQSITVPSGFLQKDFDDQLQIKTLIVPNIADLHQFHFRPRVPLRPRFIVTRHLHPMYNIPCIVHAFKKILVSFPESFLTIVGDGSQRKRIQDLIQSLGLDRNVALIGKVSHDQLPELYDAHDIFINASNVDNLPGAILEAFASGLPVVSTRAGGIPHLVEHQRTGFLVDLNDDTALAQVSIDLLKSPETSATIAQNALDYVQNYSWDRVRQILVPLLESACAGTPG